MLNFGLHCLKELSTRKPTPSPPPFGGGRSHADPADCICLICGGPHAKPKRNCPAVCFVRDTTFYLRASPQSDKFTQHWVLVEHPVYSFASTWKVMLSLEAKKLTAEEKEATWVPYMQDEERAYLTAKVLGIVCCGTQQRQHR